MDKNQISLHRTSCKIGEGDFTFEVGKIATQANGAVLARLGDTVVLATAVMSKEARENIDFFPLLVDYEERLYAAGKIKGSRWIKREGRATDEAILRGRVIDRTLRPMFPQNMRNDVQIVATVLSIDGVNEPDIVAINAASMALAISDISYDGPVAGVRVGKIENEYIVNPTHEQQEKSSLDLVVCGTKDNIIMVEAKASLATEEEIVKAIQFAQNYLAKLVSCQEDFAKQIGKAKAEVIIYQNNQQVVSKVTELLPKEKIEAAVYVKNKEERENNLANLAIKIVEKVKTELKELKEEVNLELETQEVIDKILKKYQQQQILQHERRVDGRKLNETRPVSCEVGVLPRTHGSALFTRGETQVLTTVTLGSKGDEQILDSMEDPMEGRAKRYIHHYNMPGYSVGEVAPIRGPGRREIGHGALAERAVEGVLPPQEEFPYTMRLVSEVMSSNGSTSMAATCGSTLALMDAGVPIKHVIGGVAMGLVINEEDPKNYKVLTDIAGIEDFNGHMDFKVTGNEQGITALQLDIKVKGLTAQILEEALEQAKAGRLHILDKMKEVLSAPRPELSPFAPRIVSFKIKPEKIREVIGSGGKIINEIIQATGVKIDIEDDGLVMICSSDAAASGKAVEWIKNIVREVEPGEIFEGKITRLMDFGAFVEVLPGKEGLVHISELANYHVGRVEDVCKVGDIFKVKVTEIDEQGRINLTHKPFAAPAPAGYRNDNNFERRNQRGGNFRANNRGHNSRSPRRNFDR